MAAFGTLRCGIESWCEWGSGEVGNPWIRWRPSYLFDLSGHRGVSCPGTVPSGFENNLIKAFK